MTTTMIQRWGNSSAVRIPKQLANKLGLTLGSEVELTEAGGSLVIRPARRRSRYKLADLLKSCKGKKHADHWTAPVGDELI